MHVHFLKKKAIYYEQVLKISKSYYNITNQKTINFYSALLAPQNGFIRKSSSNKSSIINMYIYILSYSILILLIQYIRSKHLPFLNFILINLFSSNQNGSTTDLILCFLTRGYF
ncbi:hypothetical protein AK88_00308 [Plasmodium fragile]|uniref:Uncharacterized protein n=1 Tax=Plasmodium fragile TaxID=5857 RepID=A0A0D9QSX3_PLAFR|nr:uncharacterized protein AK88_00308 [Plasmodium fragile]KJP90139.1 hypothetical protein AK88_00308 [Plasmodium fragile]